MVGDTADSPTPDGCLYLAPGIGWDPRTVGGYAMADDYKTPLPVDAVRMAARSVTSADGALFHLMCAPTTSAARG